MLLFGWLCYRFLNTVHDKPATLLFLASECAVAVMVLTRRATDQISVRSVDWIIGFGGTMLPMLVAPSGGGSNLAVGLLLMGLVISLSAKFTLRRSFGVVAANRGVKRSGLYGAVRHPMYLGYFVTYAGFLVLHPSVLNGMLIAAWAILQIMRIHAEETMLMRDPEYQSHAANVRFRLLPYIY